ncbi:PREDICTED: probable galactose-1-phosphate uridylyltransferase [Eufriesea mexicana]|uniref:probable galactose-1-phosphate uridylyltransferase n=1 Tax=Eufriesea mexicana TaxID=516756 RepID=UPI00083BEC06|nr:PREDICTED: probable galactose-1-phosphate uridylyltransferase [Eufriesea mexicana]
MSALTGDKSNLKNGSKAIKEEFDPIEHQHIRYNPLKGEWVLVSPHRMKRPWGGQTESNIEEDLPDYDPDNPLCPGNIRASGQITPIYENTYSFVNDFPALLESVPSPSKSEDELFQMDTAKEIKQVVKRWIFEMLELGEKWTWVQIFENRGALMGCSNTHPHCQIWASSFLPNEAKIKDRFLSDYYNRNKKPLLIDYVQKELFKKERIVLENRDWVVLVPFWAVWPYETMVLPKKQVSRMQDLTESEQESLAVIMKRLCTRYDNLFHCSFPYSMGWHGAPTGPYVKQDYPYWTFHGIYLPPLLRSATVKKHMVGYELLAQAQRDLTPEQAAEKLRNSSDFHYKHPETSLTSCEIEKYYK